MILQKMFKKNIADSLYHMQVTRTQTAYTFVQSDVSQTLPAQLIDIISKCTTEKARPGKTARMHMIILTFHYETTPV